LGRTKHFCFAYSNKSFRKSTRKKCGFVTATKLGTTDKIFVAATKNFAAATKRFVGRTKHFVVVKNVFVIPILTNDFVSITKPFFPVQRDSLFRELRIISPKNVLPNERNAPPSNTRVPTFCSVHKKRSATTGKSGFRRAKVS